VGGCTGTRSWPLMGGNGDWRGHREVATTAGQEGDGWGGGGGSGMMWFQGINVDDEDVVNCGEVGS
jgi:hypothetical protein